jgi:hypothetical protein
MDKLKIAAIVGELTSGFEILEETLQTPQGFTWYKIILNQESHCWIRLDEKSPDGATLQDTTEEAEWYDSTLKVQNPETGSWEFPWTTKDGRPIEADGGRNNAM